MGVTLRWHLFARRQSGKSRRIWPENLCNYHAPHIRYRYGYSDVLSDVSTNERKSLNTPTNGMNSRLSALDIEQLEFYKLVKADIRTT